MAMTLRGLAGVHIKQILAEAQWRLTTARGLHGLASVATAAGVLALSRCSNASLASAIAAPRRFLVGSTSTASSLRLSKLRMLEDVAKASPEDADAQALFYKELNKTYPEAVVERYESERFASNEACAREYRHALRRMGHTEEAHSYSREKAGASSSRRSSSREREEEEEEEERRGRTYYGKAETSQGSIPIQVVLPEPSFRSQAWKSFRVFIVIALILTFGSTLLDEKGGIGKAAVGLGLAQEVQPSKEQSKKFSDVMGVDEAKGELQEVVEFLKNPLKFTRLGGRLPKGILLVGPPGTGKTLLARAVAGEAGVPFFYASGSEFEELFVGVGARRVRELFASAKKKAPCIIFIDEIDAVGAKRNPKDQQYMRMTLNQLLAEMDGFNSSDGVIVVAATNFPETLDKALIRPGRFDRRVTVPTPDINGRTQILELHSTNVLKGPDVDLKVIARGTPGMTGAELSNLVNIAAVRAATRGEPHVTMSDLEYAKDRVIMGAERKSVRDPKELELTAFHEGGHAIVAAVTEGAEPIHKATIMWRGNALGMTAQLPEKDRYSQSRKQMLARLDVLMGGRVAEELIYGDGEVTSGAASDIMGATQLARHMVFEAGMSDKIGKINYTDHHYLSDEYRRIADQEVKRLVDEAYDRARAVLRSREKELRLLAQRLLEKETLTGDEICDILGVPRPSARAPAPTVLPTPAPAPDAPAAPSGTGSRLPVLPAPARAR
eukprot:tig00001600_g9394.t1